MSVIEPLPWWPVMGIPLIAPMSTALPDGVLGDVARGGHVAVAALERGDRRLEAAGGEELERGQHAPVDRARADVPAAAGVDLHARVGEQRGAGAGSLPAGGSGRSTGTSRRARRTGCGRPRGRPRSARGASSRRGSASGRRAARRGRPGRMRKRRCGDSPSCIVPTWPSTVPAMTCEPFLQRAAGRCPSCAGRADVSMRLPKVASSRRGDRSAALPVRGRVGEEALLAQERRAPRLAERDGRAAWRLRLRRRAGRRALRAGGGGERRLRVLLRPSWTPCGPRCPCAGGRGTAWSCATEPGCRSRSGCRTRPRSRRTAELVERPIFTTRASCVATAGEPFLAKTRISLRALRGLDERSSGCRACPVLEPP